jgi:hypothetical protein
VLHHRLRYDRETGEEGSLTAADRRFEINTGEVTSKILDGEAIIINLNDGLYYSLDGTGAVVWGMAAAGHDADEIAGELAARFGAPPDGARADVERILEELVAERLLVPAREEGSAEPAATEDLPSGGGYRPPKLEKYTDMSDMLALDPPLPGIRDVPWQAPEGRESD